MSKQKSSDLVRERFYRVFLEHNLKLTRPRRALIEHLMAKKGWHFQAEDLLRELNEKSPGVASRATVYRTLDLLVESEVLTRTRVHENSYRYELADIEGHHHHMVDIRTGRVLEFTGDEDLHRMLDRICAEKGFKEHYHVLEVYGEFDVASSADGAVPGDRDEQLDRSN
ncbi:transcriptional repressor [bacterium]|nr:transcriptional repressor [bacterium]